MCGFVGYVLHDNMMRPNLQNWSMTIRHRGPDQSGEATDGAFGIGTRRLSIVDLSAAGSQPMHGQRYILGYNGEVYNHQTLRTELEDAGVQFSSRSDTETILRAIEHWGIAETLPRLNGMYALSIWDRRERELTLARDPLGIKPLYYLQSGAGLYFSSELKALRQFSSGRVSRDGAALYLFFGFVPAPFSLLEGVSKVQAGEALTFTARDVVKQAIAPRMWSRRVAVGDTHEERVCQVRSTVTAAISRQLMSDVPVGVFLSGGIDSSIVAAVASSQHGGLASFSIRPEATVQDPGAQQDADIAARFAATLGMKHHEVVLHPRDFLQSMDALPALIDEPVAEPYFLAEVLLSRQARAHNVPVVLTGHGGDELFLGYPTYQAALKGDQYNAIPFLGPLLKTIATVPVPSADVRANLRGTASIWRKPPMERYEIVSGVYNSAEEAAAMSGLSTTAVSALVQATLSNVSKRLPQLPSSGTLATIELFARMDMLLKVPEHYNMRLDKGASSASIEARVPLQDLDLIGVVMQLPYEDLLQGGLKGLLKQAFSDVVPREILGRRKQTFQAPTLSWIRGPLHAWVFEQLADLPASLRPALDHVDLAIESRRSAYQLWSLALLESWRHAFELEW
jgi:asparagine synthase (glutamine-hydrolysing)